jgi:hypothetical protein
MEMKDIAIALGILITTTAIGSTSAAEIPKELRGYWCANKPGWTSWPDGSVGTYRRCRFPITDAEDAFGVFAREWSHEMADGICKPLRVTPYGNGHFVIRAHCNAEDTSIPFRPVQRWRLFNSGRRLEIRDARPGGRGKASP